MIQFFKNLSLANKLIFGIGGILIFGIAIASIIYAVLTQMDRAFLEADSGAPVLWEKCPIAVVLHPDLNEHIEYIDRHVMYMNNIFGINLFMRPVLAADAETWHKLVDPAREKKARHKIALVEPDWVEVVEAQTMLTYDNSNGKIMAAIVTVSGRHLAPDVIDAPLTPVILHELGHVLGLAHDDDSDSLMHQSLDSLTESYPQADSGIKLIANKRFTKKDLELIRKTYAGRH